MTKLTKLTTYQVRAPRQVSSATSIPVTLSLKLSLELGVVEEVIVTALEAVGSRVGSVADGLDGDAATEGT